MSKRTFITFMPLIFLCFLTRCFWMHCHLACSFLGRSLLGWSFLACSGHFCWNLCSNHCSCTFSNRYFGEKLSGVLSFEANFKLDYSVSHFLRLCDCNNQNLSSWLQSSEPILWLPILY